MSKTASHKVNRVHYSVEHPGLLIIAALGHKSSQAKIHSPSDTQAKYTEQSATNVPLWSTGTQDAPCRKQQAGRE